MNVNARLEIRDALYGIHHAVATVANMVDNSERYSEEELIVATEVKNRLEGLAYELELILETEES